MLTAIKTVHCKNGPWLSNGGYEYNVVLIAAALRWSRSVRVRCRWTPRWGANAPAPAGRSRRWLSGRRSAPSARTWPPPPRRLRPWPSPRTRRLEPTRRRRRRAGGSQRVEFDAPTGKDLTPGDVLQANGPNRWRICLVSPPTQRPAKKRRCHELSALTLALGVLLALSRLRELLQQLQLICRDAELLESARGKHASTRARAPRPAAISTKRFPAWARCW